MKTVTISVQELNVLRETFKIASKILDSYGDTGNLNVPSISLKETAKQRKDRYTKMLETKSRGIKPQYLKKKNGKI